VPDATDFIKGALATGVSSAFVAVVTGYFTLQAAQWSAETAREASCVSAASARSTALRQKAEVFLTSIVRLQTAVRGDSVRDVADLEKVMQESLVGAAAMLPYTTADTAVVIVKFWNTIESLIDAVAVAEHSKGSFDEKKWNETVLKASSDLGTALEKELRAADSATQVCRSPKSN
jgi:hypothetical protein